MTTTRFVRFNVVGAGGVIVQLATMWILVSALKLSYLIATPLAVAAALVLNFIGHWHWTWRDRRWPGPPGSARRRAIAALRTFASFALANGAVSVFGNLVVMAALVDGAGLGPVPANALAIAICGLVNFWLGDVVVFRNDIGCRFTKSVKRHPMSFRYVRVRTPNRIRTTCVIPAARNPTNHA